MVPWLDKFSKEPQQLGRSGILKFFTDLEVVDDFSTVQHKQLWPFTNLDLAVLQKLTFSSSVIDNPTSTALNTLIARGCFVNLTELRFHLIDNLDQTLTLTHMPSLKLLRVYRCKFQGQRALPLALANDIRLSTLTYAIDYDVEKILPPLTQAINLEYLSLWCNFFIDKSKVTGTQRDLIRAIILHKDTLCELCLFDKIVPLGPNLEAILWGFF